MSYIKLSGVTFENRQEIISKLFIGQKLLLINDDKNVYDEFAVRVTTEQGKDVGFIPKGINIEYFRNIKNDPNYYYARVYQKTGGGYYSNLGLVIQIEENDHSVNALKDCYFKKALDLYNSFSFTKEMIECFIKASQNNMPNALYYLGNVYLYGLGVDINVNKAIEYYENGSELNDGDCQFNLGTLYGDNVYIKPNYLKAKKYYEKAVENGNNLSLTNLGYIYYNGLGVPKDYKKALFYYKKAFKIKDANGICNLALMYEKGHGVKCDYKKALTYYKLAAEYGSSSAFFNLGSIYFNGELGVDLNIDKGIFYYKKAAELDNLDAQINLGIYYSNGKYINPDYKKALKYFMNGAEKENDVCEFYVGYIYIKAYGNMKEGFKFIESSAKKGNKNAEWFLNYINVLK